MEGMTRAKAKELNGKLKELFAKFNADNNVQIKTGNITFQEDNFTTKLTLRLLPKNGKTLEQQDFEDNCRLYNLEPSNYGEIKTLQKVAFRLTGFKLNSRSGQKVVVKGVENGKEYNLLLKHWLNAQKIESL